MFLCKQFYFSLSDTSFFKDDLRCKQLTLFIFCTELIIKHLYEQHLILVKAVPWVRPFLSEFSVYSVVM